MDYTKEQRKEIHAQLLAAKPHLWDGKGTEVGFQMYLCHAICAGQKVNFADSTLAVKMIQKRISPEYTVSAWLRKRQVDVDVIQDIELQTYRHEWLDHLIKEFSKSS